MRTFIITSTIVLLIVGCGWMLGAQEAPEEPVEPRAPLAHVTVGEPTFETPTVACPGDVDALPVAPELFAAQDPRLRGETLIVVLKAARRLMLFHGGLLGRDRAQREPSCWRVALGIDNAGNSTARGDKRRVDDRRTPEGWFRTSDKPWSQYKNAVLIHYPDARRAALGLNNGLVTRSQHDRIVDALTRGTAPPQDTRLGGEILIHGGGSNSDWTWGCIALADADLLELRAALPEGMRTWILILP